MPSITCRDSTNMNSDAFVTVDLALAESALTRQMLMEDIQQAAFNDGFFVIENYQNLGLNDDTLMGLSQQLCQFFTLSDTSKRRLDIANSPHFRGHISYSNSGSNANEEAVFGTDSPAPSQFDDEVEDMSETQTMGGTPVYQWLRGPNQWPSNRVLPGFKRDVKTFIDSMAQFAANFGNEYFSEAIGGDASLFETAFDIIERQNILRLIKKAGDMGKENTSDSFSFRNKLAFASYLIRPENDSSSLQIVGSDGRVTVLPPNPKTIVVVLGEALEQLTQGLCMSASYSLVSSPTTSYVAAFTQCLTVDFNYKNFVFPSSILKQATDLIYDDEKETPSQFFDDYGMSAFTEFLKHFSPVAGRWYSHLSSSSYVASGTLPRKLELLLKLQKSIDKSILLHTISSSASISAPVLCSRVSQDSRLTFEMSYLQQILTIWPDSYIVSPSVVNTSELTISLPPALDKKMTLMNSTPIRYATFRQHCLKYAENHSCDNIPLHAINICQAASLPPRRILSPRGPARVSVTRTVSRESSSPYSLTRKVAPLTGLSPSKLNRPGNSAPLNATVKKGSFMERIRAKEAAAKEALKTTESPELRHQRYIESKLLSVASVVAGLRKSRHGGMGETLALQHVLSKIRDSAKSTLSPSESEEVLRMLAKRMPDLCTLRTVGKVTGVYIHNGLPVTEIQQRLAVTAA